LQIVLFYERNLTKFVADRKKERGEGKGAFVFSALQRFLSAGEISLYKGNQRGNKQRCQRKRKLKRTERSIWNKEG
jgi:hypothetical protein